MSTSAPNDDTEPQEHATPQQFPHEEPEWAKRLMRAMEDLPGKLTATVTDEDKSGIAEHVHRLFEGSGAFETERETDSDVKEDEAEAEQSEEEQAPTKGNGLSGFARRFAGEG